MQTDNAIPLLSRGRGVERMASGALVRPLLIVSDYLFVVCCLSSLFIIKINIVVCRRVLQTQIVRIEQNKKQNKKVVDGGATMRMGTKRLAKYQVR